jgi:hypothetical protein
MEPPVRPLLVRGHDIPAPRYPRGWRHPLAALVAFGGVALLGGSRRDRARADWGRGDGQKRVRAVGVTRDKTPGAAPLAQVRGHLDRTLVEAPLRAWAERVRTALPPAPGAPEALALEGKPPAGQSAARRSSRPSALGAPSPPGADPVAPGGDGEDDGEPGPRGRVTGTGRSGPGPPRAIAPRIVEGGGD